MLIPVVEMFYSLQGEGLYTGRPSIFIRLFGCNFECNGFSNTDSEGNIGEIPIKQVDSIEELSNDDFTKGCDSRYSWHKDYKHLAEQMTAEQIADRCRDIIPENLNLWDIDFIFTGGEPLMNQNAMVEILDVLSELSAFSENRPVTLETNASLPLKRKFIDLCNNNRIVVHFSNSPKLSTSGEPRSKAWSPKALESQMLIENMVRSFKFVVGTEDEVAEVGEYLQHMQEHFDARVKEENWLFFDTDRESVYLMPVGATQEQQNSVLPFIADQCMQNGYSLSMRCHVYAFGNALGT